MKTPENQTIELRNLLDAHHEWLLIDAQGRSFALRSDELEIACERGKVLLGFLDEKGFQTWRVAEFTAKNEELRLRLVRNFEREHVRLRLVPRALAKELGDAVAVARLDRANRLAALLKETWPTVKLVRVALNKAGGRLAEIVFEDPQTRRQTAVLSDVSEDLTPEIMLSSAILRLAKLEKRRKDPISALWIAAEKRPAKRLQKLHALLTENWKSRIFIKEIYREDAGAQSGEVIKALPKLEISDLWRGKTPEIRLPETFELGAAARRLIEYAPDAIDAVFAGRGATLRFHGLAFARARRVLETEQIWFGVQRSRRLLAEDNFDEFTELLETLRKIRRPDSPNRRHAFYRDAPEAWLEAAFRRNIKLLDANLVLSPLYHQFRAGRERVDLLALRRDGRLVIIELKTAPDREMVFQAADYWRRIERRRRRGQLSEARLFGDLKISDAPAVCYLAAPTLSFHREFELLAAALAPGIELHRFNLAENWRAQPKVLDRREIQDSRFKIGNLES